MKGSLKDMLFYTNPEAQSLSHYVSEAALKFILPLFILTIIIEYFDEWKFERTLKHLIVTVIALSAFSKVHRIGVKYSFDLASTMTRRFSKDNVFLSNWKESFNYARKNRGKDSEKGDDQSIFGLSWDSFSKNVGIVVDDFVIFSLWVFCAIAFIILKQIYSFVYYFTDIFLPISALLSMLPVTRGALQGAIKSSLWCMLMPIVVAILLCLAGNSIRTFSSDPSAALASDLEGLIHVTVMVILLLGTGFVTQKIIDGSGLGSYAGQVGQMAAMSSIMTLQNKVIKSNIKKYTPPLLKAVAIPPLKKASESLSRPLQSSLSQHAHQYREKYGGNPNLSDVIKQRNDLKKPETNTPKAPKQRSKAVDYALYKADSLVNHKRNKTAEIFRNNYIDKALKNPESFKKPESIKLDLKKFLPPVSEPNYVKTKIEKAPPVSRSINKLTPKIKKAPLKLKNQSIKNIGPKGKK